jgi:hypothetical protein
LSSRPDEMDIDIEVRRRGNEYILVAYQFGVVVRSKELKSGIEELERRVAIISEDLHEAGILVPSGAISRTNHEISGPFARSLVVVLVAVVAVMGSLILVTAAPIIAGLLGVRSAISAIVPAEAGSGVGGVGRLGIDLIIKVSQTLDQVTPERKEELRTAIRKIAREVDLIVQDVKELPPTSPQPPSNGDKR